MSELEAKPEQATPDAGADPAALKLYVGFYNLEKPDQFHYSVARHMGWAGEQERAGRIFLAGPLTSPDKTSRLSGITLFRADSIEHAEALAKADPFVIDGVMAVQVRQWTVVGGAINLSLQLSKSSVAIR